MKLSKRTERIITAGMVAVLVAYFCYQVAYGVSETITNGNVTATITAPPGSKINNFTIVPERNTSYAYPPPTITYSWEPAASLDCSNCYFQTFTIHDGPYVYQGYRYSGDSQTHRGNLHLYAHKKDIEGNLNHPVKNCVTLWPSFEPSYKWGIGMDLIATSVL